MSVIEIITDSSINTTTDVGIVNLTQTEPLLCGFITIDTGNVYDLISFSLYVYETIFTIQFTII